MLKRKSACKIKVITFPLFSQHLHAPAPFTQYTVSVLHVSPTSDWEGTPHILKTSALMTQQVLYSVTLISATLFFVTVYEILPVIKEPF